MSSGTPWRIIDAVMREIAFYHARQDREGLNATLSTALVCAAAAFAIGLAVFARVRLRQKLAHADATMRGAPMLDV